MSFLILFFLGISIYGQNKAEELLKKLDESTNVNDRIAYLDTLTNLMVRKNHPKKLQYLLDYVNLTSKQGEYDLAANKSRFLIQEYINEGDFKAAFKEIETQLKNVDKFKKKSSEAHVLLKKGALYYHKEQLDSAAIDYDKSGELFLKSNDSIFAADALFFAGQVYFDKNDFLNSVQRFEKAYQLYIKLGDASYANYTLNELSSLYGKNGFHDKAIYERKRILSGAKKMNDPTGIFYAYSHLFTSYAKKNELNIAKKYLDSMTSSYADVKNEMMKRGFSMHLAKIKTKYYLKAQKLDSVYKYLKEFDSKLKSSKRKDQYHKNSFLLYSGQYHSAKLEYPVAEKFYKKLLNKNNKLGDEQLRMEANKQLSDVLSAQRKIAESYKYLKAYTKAKDSIERRITTNTFLYYQSQFETQRKDSEIFKNETEITLLEKDKEISEAKRRILWFILFSVIVLSAFISYFIWYKGKMKRKVLAQKIAENKQELTSYTNQLLEKSKIQESLTQELEKLKEEIGNQKSIEKINDLTTTKILTSDDWYIFKEKFTKVHPTFFMRLKDKGYNLTKSEERLLAMEKLYLDTKQIATMLAISNDSVVRSRSRLRKKVNAPKGSSILEYLEAS
ncbi:hypothetical protein [Tenacibaculum jejuense]|uniref:hypothetical protein n=1 Tax=Tenacibaculum jejuense TaxID=584609 RepID=UPI0012FDB386|nr:hypothetical protein [Tenacibaculum jejuense]